MTIFPTPCCFMRCTAALVHRKVPLRLNRTTVSHSSGVSSSTLASPLAIIELPPTAFTRDVYATETGDHRVEHSLDLLCIQHVHLHGGYLAPGSLYLLGDGGQSWLINVHCHQMSAFAGQQLGRGLAYAAGRTR